MEGKLQNPGLGSFVITSDGLEGSPYPLFSSVSNTYTAAVMAPTERILFIPALPVQPISKLRPLDLKLVFTR